MVVAAPGAPARGASAPGFMMRVAVIHVVTYVVAGAVFAAVFDYREIFEQPVIREYMLPFGAPSLTLSIALQVGRGVVLGLVLLPLRVHLARSRWGWVQLWLLLIGIGMIATSAAAPSSIEGLIYSRLPLWYHLVGLPEMLLQTLAFSWLVHLQLRHPEGLRQMLPSSLAAALKAVVVASIAFVGYAAFSIGFAVVVGADLGDGRNLGLRTQGMFLTLFVVNVAIMLACGRNAVGPDGRRHRISLGLSMYVTNALVIAGYQLIVLGGVGPAYPLLAPIVPSVLTALAAPAAPTGGRASQQGVDVAEPASPRRGER